MESAAISWSTEIVCLIYIRRLVCGVVYRSKWSVYLATTRDGTTRTRILQLPCSEKTAFWNAGKTRCSFSYVTVRLIVNHSAECGVSISLCIAILSGWDQAWDQAPIPQINRRKFFSPQIFSSREILVDTMHQNKLFLVTQPSLFCHNVLFMVDFTLD